MSKHLSIQTGGPMAVLTVSLIVTSFVLLFLGGSSYLSNLDVQEAIEREVRLEELRGTILHLDEVLTMSARMGVVTGDTYWEGRYLEFEPQLDAALKEAIALIPSASSHLKAAQTNAANIKLVEMEKRAFDLIRSGRVDEAHTLLFSEEYEQQKRIYSDGMHEFNVTISDVISLQLQEVQQKALWNFWALAFLTPLLVASWVVMFRAVRRWEIRLSEANAHLTQQAEDLLELNRSLDQRVSERTQELETSKDALQKSQVFLNATGQVAKVGGWELDPDTLTLNWTEETYRIHDVTLNPESEQQWPFDEMITFYHSEDRPKFQQGIQRAIEDGQPFDMEARFITGKGKHLWTHTICQPQIVDGRVVKLIGTIQDITERKQMQEALARLSLLQEQILRSAGEGIYGLDLDGNITFVNPAAAAMIGWDMEELIGKSQHDILHHSRPDGSPYPREACPIYSALQDGRVCHVENEVFWRKDGTSFPVEYTSTPIRNEANQLLGAVVMFRNIFARKQAEQQLRDAYEQMRELSRRLSVVKEAERTHLARELHDEFGQMLAALKFDMAWMTHRLKQNDPLQSPDRLLEKLSSMAGILDQTIQIVRRISTDLRPSLLDNLGLMVALEWQSNDFHSRTGIRCELTMSPDIEQLTIAKDVATAFFRITQELLTNVIRHANASVVSIDFRIEKENTLVLQLHDNGVGIMPQGESQKGCLGILGMRERAMLLGGDLTITGKEGQGTTVLVMIPIQAAALRPEQALSDTRS